MEASVVAERIAGSKGLKAFASVVVVIALAAFVVGAAFFLLNYYYAQEEHLPSEVEERDREQNKVAMGRLFVGGALIGIIAFACLYWLSMPSETLPESQDQDDSNEDQTSSHEEIIVGAPSIVRAILFTFDAELKTQTVKHKHFDPSFDINKPEDIEPFDGKQIYDCCKSPAVKDDATTRFVLVAQLGPINNTLPKVNLEECVNRPCALIQRSAKLRLVLLLNKLENVAECRRKTIGGTEANPDEIEIKGTLLNNAQVTLFCPQTHTIKGIYRFLVNSQSGNSAVDKYNAWNSYVTLQGLNFTTETHPTIKDIPNAEKLDGDLKSIDKPE